MPGEYAVLGLLLQRPKHGYEMARYFDRDDLAEVCPIEQSMLYTYLRNVEERGLVQWSEARVGNRPPRKLFELSAHGRDLIETWLEWKYTNEHDAVRLRPHPHEFHLYFDA